MEIILIRRGSRTERLAERLMGALNPAPHKTIVRWMRAIQACLTDDLLSPKERRRRRAGSHPHTGHCYVASEALHHLTGRSLKPCCGSYRGRTHWWLETRGKCRLPAIYDPTGDQFGDKQRLSFYLRGRGTGFLTWKPSRRARILIDRVNARTK